METVYGFKVLTIDKQEISLDKYKGKVLLIVNVASKCGFTPQYTGLEALYKKYKDTGFEILGFPSNQFMNQEPGNEEEIKNFCSLKYNVTFPLFAKIDVNGDNAAPLYKFLRKKTRGFFSDNIKWNFTKFLIKKDGTIFKKYAPSVKPEELVSDIEMLLK
ncbi:MAG: glutathione peroxidase [Spirochaetes bacterium GWD1_27_9]|nr:MAG: glutathione peroxidase [Spirochaetes bacterium GWB1_27_13]OHD28089.1 MAG: glutathione peroxidase [Spirochaetes bacterium GWC1_27_15]OHD32560.1 MAG: glutathione peroxidase [Spirochaetes bacterium GWD1_27_9]